MAQIILDSNNNLIQGDFDNATLNNRTKLQTTTTNATTNVYVVPNGSSTSAGVSVANNSDLTNASKIVMATNGSTDTQIISGINGSGTYLPLSFYTNNTLAAQISTAGVFSATGGIAASSMPTGSVVQVVNATYATQTTSTSNTLADTGLQAIITPSSSSNKILVMYTVPVQKNSGDVSNGISFGMSRNGTSFGNAEWLSYGAWTGSSVNNRAGYSNMLLDTPSSTSALTYKLRFCETYGSVGVTICHDGSYATMTLMEIKG